MNLNNLIEDFFHPGRRKQREKEDEEFWALMGQFRNVLKERTKELHSINEKLDQKRYGWKSKDE